MKKASPVQSIHGAIVTSVMFVDRIERFEKGAFQSRSLPGHLIHICTEGEVEQYAGGVRQHFCGGEAIWYYEDEPVRGSVVKAPWVFYTINFSAPSLPPPPLSDRVTAIDGQTVAHVERLLDVWHNEDAPPLLRHLRVHALLLEILADLFPGDSQHRRIDGSAFLWWEIESIIRKHLDEPIDLAKLVKLSGRSDRSISRACRLATGMSPIKRVKQVRLNYARGLTQFSDCSMTEIAYRIGYTRVQEFSRDYRRCFGMTPTEDRRTGADFRVRQSPDDDP